MKNTIFKISLALIVSLVVLFFGNFVNAETSNIKSDEYLISNTNDYNYIARIPPNTKVETFKNAFSVSKEYIKVYKDSSLKEEITTGNITTNMWAKFSGIDGTYKLIVVGDLDGDGLVTGVEITRMIRNIVGYLNGTIEGSDVLAADVNDDGKIDQLDLTSLINYLVYGRFTASKENEVKKPSIILLRW